MMFTCPSGSGGRGDSSPSRKEQAAGLFPESPRPLKLQNTLSTQTIWPVSQMTEDWDPQLRGHRPGLQTLGEAQYSQGLSKDVALRPGVVRLHNEPPYIQSPYKAGQLPSSQQRPHLAQPLGDPSF